MEENAYFTNRTSPPDPFAVRHTRPWRRRRLRKPKLTFCRLVNLVLPWAFWGSLLAASTLGLLEGGPTFYVSLPIFLFALAVVLFLLHWELREIVVGNCPRCKSGLANSGDFSFRRPRWCPKCSYLVRPEDFEGMLDKWAKDRGMVTLIVEPDPNIKLLSMLLTLSLKRRVEGLVIEPGTDDYRTYFIEEGAILEEEPPYPPMHRSLVAAARAIWKGDPYDDSVFESTQEVSIGALAASVTLTVTPTPAGEVLRFQFSYPNDVSTNSSTPQPAVMV